MSLDKNMVKLCNSGRISLYCINKMLKTAVLQDAGDEDDDDDDDDSIDWESSDEESSSRE